MSLPTPTTTTTTSANSMNDHHHFDRESERLYIELVQRSHGDLRQLLSSFFSFLHRRTDLYCIMDENENHISHNSSKNNSDVNTSAITANTRNMGFKEGEAEKIIIAAFRQFPLRKITPPSTVLPVVTPAQQPSSSISSNSKMEETTSIKTPATTPNPAATTASTTTSGTTAGVMMHAKSDSHQKSGRSYDDEIQYTEEGLQIPIGNGGITSKYRWTQTLEECTVLVQCPNHATPLRGKDIQVTLLPNLLRVQILNNNNNNKNIDGKSDSASAHSDIVVLLDGELSQRIVPSESTWTIESNVIQIVLFKHLKTFWDSIYMNDTIKIDTSLVDSRRNIDTYDEVTQAHLRKIIFEQQQQSQGISTSTDDAIITSGDGVKPKIPSVLPKGVEYIDQEILDTKMKELGK